MPELPEVETVRRGLEPHLNGVRCRTIICRREGLRYPFPRNIHTALEGASVKGLTRRGKYLCLHFDNAYTLILHLGMSGALRLLLPDDAQDSSPAAHDHFLMHFDDNTILIFNDPRRFGMVYLVQKDELYKHPALQDMGPEPLDAAFDSQVLAQRLSRHKAPVKNVLLDQNVVAGLGNIYVCEALYDAGILPRRPAGSLSDTECEALHIAIVNVLNRAIAAGGASLRDHKRVDGTIGYFQHAFRVYQREGESCAYCDCRGHMPGAIVCERLAGRATFFCPNHQS
jgi:formamidopyrimidine-DNA glycosylase